LHNFQICNSLHKIGNGGRGHTEFIDIFNVYIHTQFHLPSSRGSLVITIKQITTDSVWPLGCFTLKNFARIAYWFEDPTLHSTIAAPN